LNLKVGPTGACCQEWNNLAVRGLVVESKQQMIFFLTFCCNYSSQNIGFATPFMSFFICKQDPLLTDIHLLQGTNKLPNVTWSRVGYFME